MYKDDGIVVSLVVSSWTTTACCCDRLPGESMGQESKFACAHVCPGVKDVNRMRKKCDVTV